MYPRLIFWYRGATDSGRGHLMVLRMIRNIRESGHILKLDLENRIFSKRLAMMSSKIVSHRYLCLISNGHLLVLRNIQTICKMNIYWQLTNRAAISSKQFAWVVSESYRIVSLSSEPENPKDIRKIQNIWKNGKFLKICFKTTALESSTFIRYP